MNDKTINLREFIQTISYNKTETYTKQEVIEEILNLELFKVVDNLPTENIRMDKLYLLKTDNEYEDGDTFKEYDFYLYENGQWQQIDQLKIDLDDYYTQTQIDNLLYNKANKVHSHNTEEVKDTSAYNNIGSSANATQKVINNKINAKIETLVPKSDIIDNTVTDDNTKVLSAKQGKSLQDSKAPNNHADPTTFYGASTDTMYGHSKATSTTPKMNGTATVGVETSTFARGDHIHPSDTSKANSSHSHGNIGNGGSINSNTDNVNNILVTDNTHKIRTVSSIGTDHIDDGSITESKLADDSVTSSSIVNGTIVNGDIADSTITGDKIVNGTIENDKITNTTITGAKLANSTITATQLASNSVTSAKIKNANVTLAKLNADVFDTTDGGSDGSNKLITSGAVYNGLSTKADSGSVYNKNETLNTTQIGQAIANGVSNVELFELKSTLPSSGMKGNKFYLIPNNKNEDSNVYDIYIYVNDNWEKIDSLEFNITDYPTTSDVTGMLNDYVTKLQTTANMNVVTGSDKKITLESKNNHAHGNISSDGKIGSTQSLPLITGANGVVTTGTFGNTTGTFAEGNDSRLSDTRVPKFNYIHASSTNIQDLNEYTRGGFYYCESDSIYAPYVIHTPLSNGTETPYTNNKAFFLLVETWGETSNYVKQTLTYYNTNITYTRTKKGNSVGWSDWKGLSQDDHTHTKSSITDFPTTMPPSTHSHGNLQDDGQVGSSVSANKNVVTDNNGKITTEDKYTHPNYTTREGKPTANLTPSFGGTVTVSQVKSDNTGHLTSVTDRTITIPNTLADGTNRGLTTNDFTTNEKTKLNGIEAGATNVTVDNSVTANGENPVTGGAIKDYVDTKVADILIDDEMDLSSTHNHDDRYIQKGTGTVTSANILNGTIVNDDIANSTIQLGKLNSNAIDTTSGGTEGSSKLITSGAVYSKLNPIVKKYDGVLVNGVASLTKPYVRLFHLQSSTGNSSSSHLIFEIVGTNNDRVYAKIRVDIRQNTVAEPSSSSSYQITPIEVTKMNLNELYFGFIDDHTNGNTSLDIFRKVNTSNYFYVKVCDDHLRNGSYTQYSPVVNGLESYTDLEEASQELYDTSYTSVTVGDNYSVVDSKLPKTNLTANSFVKTDGTSSQLLLANGGVKAVGDFANSSHNQATTSITNSENYTNLGSNLTNQKLINDAINTKIGDLTNVELVTLVTGNLPTASASTMNKLYVKTKTGGTTNDNYDIYVTIKNGTNYAWEKIDDFNLQNLSINWDSVTGKPSTFAPIAHTNATASNIGQATNSVFGHVKLADNYTSSAGSASQGIGASSKAVYDTYTEFSSSSKSTKNAHTHTKSQITDFTHTHHDTDLDWNGVSKSNAMSPLDMALYGEFNANRLSFLNPENIVVEYSTDAGSTWTEFSGESYNREKVKLVTGSEQTTFFKSGNNSTTNYANNKLRVTIKVGELGANSKIYCQSRKLLLYFNSGGGGNTTVNFETSTYATPTNWTTEGTYNVGGQSGWNSIPFGKIIGGFSNQCGSDSARIQYLRLTFNQATKNCQIQKIRLFGEIAWTTPSTLANSNHNYTFDHNQRTYFPSTIHADNIVDNIYLNDDLELCYHVKSYYRSYTDESDVGELLPCTKQDMAELSVSSNGLLINSSSGEKRFNFPVVNPKELQFTYVSGQLRGWFLGTLDDKKSIMWGDCQSTTWKIVHEGETSTQATASSPTATNGDIIRVVINGANLEYYKNNILLVTKATEGILNNKEYYFGFYTNASRNLVIKDVIIK